MTIVCVDLVARRISTMPGVPGEGAPSAGPVLTSLAYPIETTESLDVAASMAWGAMRDAVGHVNVSASWQAGTLTVTIEYETWAVPAEPLDVSASWQAGTLTVTIEYETWAVPAEALDVSASWQAGALTTVLNPISHADPADDEGLDLGATWVAGTLA